LESRLVQHLLGVEEAIIRGSDTLRDFVAKGFERTPLKRFLRPQVLHPNSVSTNPTVRSMPMRALAWICCTGGRENARASIWKYRRSMSTMPPSVASRGQVGVPGVIAGASRLRKNTAVFGLARLTVRASRKEANAAGRTRGRGSLMPTRSLERLCRGARAARSR
jgi:hypothetical protein